MLTGAASTPGPVKGWHFGVGRPGGAVAPSQARVDPRDSPMVPHARLEQDAFKDHGMVAVRRSPMTPEWRSGSMPST
jgi:hypothetical protein